MAFFSNRRQQEQTEPHEERETQVRLAPTQPVGFETVLGANSTLEGTLTSGGNVRLDGTFTGTLNIIGNVLIGETAKINADVDARNISIAGAVRGNVTGNKVQILRTGRVWGDISATALTTEEGAFIDGRITMKGHLANKADTPPVQATLTATQEALKPDVPTLTVSAEADTKPDLVLDSSIPLASSPEAMDKLAEDETLEAKDRLDPTLPVSPFARKREDEE